MRPGIEPPAEVHSLCPGGWWPPALHPGDLSSEQGPPLLQDFSHFPQGVVGVPTFFPKALPPLAPLPRSIAHSASPGSWGD